MRQGFVLLFKGFLSEYEHSDILFSALQNIQKAYNPEILRSNFKKKVKKLKSLFSDVCLSVKSFTTYSKVRHFLPIS